MMQLPQIPPNRAQLFAGFLELLYRREYLARQARHDEASVPAFDTWRQALVAVAEALQRLDGQAGDGGARTALSLHNLPPALTPELLAFAMDASVLQRMGNAVRFVHQLWQEAMAADALLDAARTGTRSASAFWPKYRWWQRSGWEVVAEIAAEALEGDSSGQVALIEWLAADHPGMALDIWHHTGQPALSLTFLERTKAQWLDRISDTAAEPAPVARMAIGRWLGLLNLDTRPGTGLCNGVPDIDWVWINEAQSFIYQDSEQPPLPAFAISRYPVTNRQWQSFVDDGGYDDSRWWQGLSIKLKPKACEWGEPTAPRENVSWFEAVAFCQWLSHKLGIAAMLPTEKQWERAARGTDGREYPWGNSWDETKANGRGCLGRTSFVGLYPDGASPAGVHDLAGNVWEWCLNEYDDPERTSLIGSKHRVVRGGAWSYAPGGCLANHRAAFSPDSRHPYLGIRLAVSYYT